MYFYPRFLKGVVFLGGFAGAVLGVGTDAVFSDDDVLSVGSDNNIRDEASDDEFEEVPAGYLEEPFAVVVYAQIEEVRNLLQNELANRGHAVPQVFISEEDWGQYSLAAIWEMMVRLTDNSRYHWGMDVLVGSDCFGQLYIMEGERIHVSAVTDFLEGRNTVARHALVLLDNVLIELASVIGEVNRVREIVRQGGVLNVEGLQRQLVLLTRCLIRGAWYTYYAARSDRPWGELPLALREQIEAMGELMWARAGGLDALIYQVAQGWTIPLFNQHFFPRVLNRGRVLNLFRAVDTEGVPVFGLPSINNTMGLVPLPPPPFPGQSILDVVDTFEEELCERDEGSEMFNNWIDR